ncbi:hypothetical protein K1719_031882 [Acacia pycnantha]|nr:hypothetical protein K1719_031882 [Acacia pycnantha]
MAAAFLFIVALPLATTAALGFQTSLTLKRAFPSNHGVELSQLRAQDGLRHRRMLQSSNGVVDFSVSGTFDPFQVR